MTTSQAHSRAADLDAAYELTAEVDTTGQERPRPAPRTGEYATGSVIAGKYQLGQFLGEGGMGSVWVARNRTLDVEVAVKLMRPELADDVDGIAERMLQEARAAASIGHPAIIQVFDFGIAERGAPFIVMELLRGESLAQAIRRRGRVNPVRAAQTLLPIVDALSAAHRLGIVHRDLKPENIFLARPAGQRLQPKVLDFGIAKLEQRAQERLTRDGAVIGSPAYMAPEQVRGEPHVDARADVWSLGVVFYEMISGHRPFEAASYHASMWNIVNAEPRPLVEHDVADAELARILQHSFMKDPQQRCPDMRSFGRALAGWLISQGVHEDVCNASLAAWVEEATPSGAAVYSFFPSDAPAADVARVEAEFDASGTRRIDARVVPAPAGAQGSARRLRRHALLVLGAAAVAFVAAALFASSERDEVGADVAVAPPPARARLREAEPSLTLAPDSAGGVLSPIASALTDDPGPVQARDQPERGTMRRSGGASKPAGKVSKKRSELKDPFD